MSRIEELIKEKCPDGVEYKTLGQLGEFMGGLTGKSKDDFSDGNAVFITYRNVYSNPSIDITPLDRVKISDGENQRTLEYGDVIFTGSSETSNECGISSVVTEHPMEKLYLNSFCFVFRFYDLSLIDPNFAKHLFRSHDLRYQISKTASGVTRFNVSKDKMKKVIIPLPPIVVQQEIVRILDKFNKLEVNLQAELDARKKQYEYYKMKLLSFGDKVPVKELKKTCNMKAGKAISASNISETKNNVQKYACFGGNGVRGYVKFQSHKGNYPIIGRQGALCGNVNYATGVFYATEHAVVVTSLGEYTQRFLYYLLAAMNLNQYKSQGAQPGLAVGNIEKLLAPVPTIEEQERITTILDTFEMICSDYSHGLPAEIEACHKQYEYYRDKLLTFKRKVV